jgi:two-component system sensor histidine kinase TctE
MNSIRLRLLKWLAAPILLINLAAAALTYQLAWTPAQRAFDAVMRGDPARVALQDAGAAEAPLARSLRQREQVRSAIVRSLVLFEAVFALALVGLVWFSVSNGLAPLARLRARLDARDSADLSAMETAGMPDELVPLVGACNALLERTGATARAQDEFMANVTHQLRTPLAGLKLQLEWLGARHAGDAETMRSVSLMLQANERMIRQTNQLLSLGRAEPSRFERTRLAPVDLAALVGESVQGLVEQAAARQIDLGFDLASAPITGDRFLLRDLIDNLVDNALRYTPEGGSVTVRCAGTVDGSVLVVEDSGPGIAPDQRERVFQRFVRLDERTTGSGLGLAIVRDVAQVHAAQVGLGERAGGSGAVFTVRFPAVCS